MSRFRLGAILAVTGILITTGGCAESPSSPTEMGAGLELLLAPEGPRAAVPKLLRRSLGRRAA
jgi:hypothetical protein